MTSIGSSPQDVRRKCARPSYGKLMSKRDDDGDSLSVGRCCNSCSSVRHAFAHKWRHQHTARGRLQGVGAGVKLYLGAFLLEPGVPKLPPGGSLAAPYLWPIVRLQVPRLHWG